MHLHENTLFIFYLNPGPKSPELLPNTLSIMLPMHLQSLKLLRPTVEKMHLQENTLFILYLMPPLHLHYDEYTMSVRCPNHRFRAASAG